MADRLNVIDASQHTAAKLASVLKLVYAVTAVLMALSLLTVVRLTDPVYQRALAPSLAIFGVVSATVAAAA